MCSSSSGRKHAFRRPALKQALINDASYTLGTRCCLAVGIVDGGGADNFMAAIHDLEPISHEDDLDLNDDDYYEIVLQRPFEGDINFVGTATAQNGNNFLEFTIAPNEVSSLSCFFIPPGGFTPLKIPGINLLSVDASLVVISRTIS